MISNASYSSSLSALSGMSHSFWFIDSAYCNHMTPHLSLFSELKSAPHPLNICTVNGFTMFGHNIDFVQTSNLSIPRVFNVPNFSYNLFFVGQLVELGYRIIFDYSGCIVQDLRWVITLPSSSTCCSCFCCCSCCSFLYSFPCILACQTWSRIFLSGTTIGFQRFVKFSIYRNFF